MKPTSRPTGRPRPTTAEGFTLVEIMISAAILVFAVTSSIVALQVGYRELELSRGMAVATQVMQSEAERLRLQNWATISALPESEEVDLSAAITSESLLYGRLRLVRTVGDVEGFSNMKEIQLEAAWTSTDGRPHTRSLTLRYSKGGLYDYYYGN